MMARRPRVRTGPAGPPAPRASYAAGGAERCAFRSRFAAGIFAPGIFAPGHNLAGPAPPEPPAEAGAAFRNLHLPMRNRSYLLLPLLPLATAACAPGDEAANNDSLPDTTAAALAEPPVLAGTISGFETPESVKHDAELDVYFITNIVGSPSAKDGDGFITRVHADSLAFPLMRWVAGGRNRVELHAPKGMAIAGDTLWVADIDQVRGFNRRSGDPVGSVDLSGMGAVFLNDVAVGPEGALYVTDTGIRFESDGSMTAPGPFRVYRIADRTPTVAVEGDTLGNPNGIAWAPDRERFVIVGFGGPTIFTWAPGERAPTPLVSGPGQHDGVAVLEDGRILVSSWADSSLYVLPPGGEELRRVVSGVDGPADIGWDATRQRVGIPLFNENRVVFYDLGGR